MGSKTYRIGFSYALKKGMASSHRIDINLHNICNVYFFLLRIYIAKVGLCNVVIN